MRIADNLLDEAVAASGVGVHIPHPERLRVKVLEGRHQVALFFVRKGLAVCYQKLHVANLRAIDGRVVDLVQNPV